MEVALLAAPELLTNRIGGVDDERGKYRQSRR